MQRFVVCFRRFNVAIFHVAQRGFRGSRVLGQAAISDTYNGDGKVYAALRAAAYVSWGIVTSLGAPSETGVRA